MRLHDRAALKLRMREEHDAAGLLGREAEEGVVGGEEADEVVDQFGGVGWVGWAVLPCGAGFGGEGLGVGFAGGGRVKDSRGGFLGFESGEEGVGVVGIGIGVIFWLCFGLFGRIACFGVCLGWVGGCCSGLLDPIVASRLVCLVQGRRSHLARC